MLSFTEHKIIRDWKDYVARSYKVFIATTHSKANLADYIHAYNTELQWLKRQYPTVKNKLIIQRAYKNLLEAYKRASEYSVKLTWRSLANFALHRRPSILWAVLQARADGLPKQQQKRNKLDKKANALLIVECRWCNSCHTTARVIQNKLECCGK